MVCLICQNVAEVLGGKKNFLPYSEFLLAAGALQPNSTLGNKNLLDVLNTQMREEQMKVALLKLQVVACLLYFQRF